ncbi:Ribosomal protein L11 methyltransferase, putative [Hondaea fermentalgiana]|uniref:Ribosomal protein L11 methyltransferase, putative n=1 Tax=Hondaea fermentalgiana TaxID=2315210 RepID=A0A2R5H187_9STRA|nr:Ribosomal protein L11 methyltransferase, putative [Hondaea fermentalgiana]|eukprot:GBG34094.1 Ribosomal protein L11 methyltransferase, putative [Hondaea fermentalgiana]
MGDGEEGIVAGAPKLAPFNPSSPDVIHRTCDLLGPGKHGAGIGEDDVVFDLGCGDARLLCAVALKYGCRCVGVEYDARFAERAEKEVEHYKVGHLVEVRHADATKVADLDRATVIFMYLNVQSNLALQEVVTAAYRRGVKIVSNMFSLKYLGDDFVEAVVCDGITRLYLYDQMRAKAKGSSTCAEDEAQSSLGEKGEEVAPPREKSAFMKKLEWFFDPLRNPYIIKIFNGAMVALFALLLFLMYHGLGNIHIYNIIILSLCLFFMVNWFIREYRAAVEQEARDKAAAATAAAAAEGEEAVPEGDEAASETKAELKKTN